jgi:AraC-like DNA-binding protein
MTQGVLLNIPPQPEPKPAEVVTLYKPLDSHSHSYAQVVVGLQGKVEFDICGAGSLIHPGQGCIVTQDASHTFGCVNAPSDILVLNLTAETEHGAEMLAKLNSIARVEQYFQMDNQLRQLIQMLVTEVYSSPDDLLLSRACNDTIIALLHNHIRAFHADPGNIRLDMTALDLYIERHLSNKLTVTQLAGSVFLSESRFYSLFKKQTGMTPHQYVLRKRIDKAKTYLEQGKASLGHIADLTGFSDHSSFTHAFTRLQGLSPSRYKKRYFS